MQLNINSDELVKFTNRLERLSKNDVPRVIKKTLDKVAMDVKKTTMPKTASQEFTTRRANFFKANSRVEFSKSSRNMNDLYSTVGFVPLSGTNKAVDDLEQQEHGGQIGGRSFVPLDQARVGRSYSRNVQAKNRLSNLNNIASARSNRARSRKARFIRTAIHVGQGGVFISERNIVFRVDKIKRFRGERNTSLKLTPLYSYKRGRSVRVDKTKFMERSSLESAQKLNDTFIDEAQKQIKFRLNR
jgi:hypothetical protein